MPYTNHEIAKIRWHGWYNGTIRFCLFPNLLQERRGVTELHNAFPVVLKLSRVDEVRLWFAKSVQGILDIINPYMSESDPLN